MSQQKPPVNDAEKTLLALDQLSQTIAVMAHVVNRLRRHLSQQLQSRDAAAQQARTLSPTAGCEGAGDNARPEVNATTDQGGSSNTRPAEQTSQAGGTVHDNSFVIEIRQRPANPAARPARTLH